MPATTHVFQFPASTEVQSLAEGLGPNNWHGQHMHNTVSQLLQASSSTPGPKHSAKEKQNFPRVSN